MKGRYLENVRKQNPLIQNITNTVTVNDVANVLLASGASPIMADYYEEMEDMVSICQGLNINIGNLNETLIKSMFIAGRKSNELNHPTILDPVGAGASKFRNDIIEELLKEVYFDVIKGNMSEIKAVFMGTSNTTGVDASVDDIVTEENKDEMVAFVKEAAKKTGSIIVATGAIDLISDSEKTYLVKNGREKMTSITGVGCQLSALLAAFLAANPENKLEAAAYSIMMMGVAGELAYEEGDGNIAYRGKIIDCIYNMTDEIIQREGKYEIK